MRKDIARILRKPNYTIHITLCLIFRIRIRTLTHWFKTVILYFVKLHFLFTFGLLGLVPSFEFLYPSFCIINSIREASYHYLHLPSWTAANAPIGGLTPNLRTYHILQIVVQHHFHEMLTKLNSLKLIK